MKPEDVEEEAIKLRAFQFSLHGIARYWLSRFSQAPRELIANMESNTHNFGKQSKAPRKFSVVGEWVNVVGDFPNPSLGRIDIDVQDIRTLVYDWGKLESINILGKSSIIDEDENNEDEEEMEWDSDEEDEEEKFQSEFDSEIQYVGLGKGFTQQRLLHLQGRLLLQPLLLRFRQYFLGSDLYSSGDGYSFGNCFYTSKDVYSSDSRFYTSGNLDFISATAIFESSTQVYSFLASFAGGCHRGSSIHHQHVHRYLPLHPPLHLPLHSSFNNQSDCEKVITKIMKAHSVEAHPSFGKVPNRIKNMWYTIFGKRCDSSGISPTGGLLHINKSVIDGARRHARRGRKRHRKTDYRGMVGRGPAITPAVLGLSLTGEDGRGLHTIETVYSTTVFCEAKYQELEANVECLHIEIGLPIPTDEQLMFEAAGDSNKGHIYSFTSQLATVITKHRRGSSSLS
ncbi:hypothetical protein M9H77_21644 [Catharanthus roseus]|uniref:Uncharacterized protein n=1 Tax=Catharanthus roseus TaxID=4058 RepID=A0ACC0ANM0_CATRO|nr:hypothetical protein M9H77_21644 [Catharanthus roseus]